MANTTFNGAVRSENGFKVINIASTTGVVTETSSQASTGIFTNKYIKHVGIVTGVTVNSTAGDSPAIGSFSQPKNTIITQIVAAITDQILDGGTTVVVGNVVSLTLVAQTESTTTAPASVQYASAARTIYCNITNTADATTAGSFTFIIEYVQVA
jgi:hypothetical protein